MIPLRKYKAPSSAWLPASGTPEAAVLIFRFRDPHLLIRGNLVRFPRLILCLILLFQFLFVLHLSLIHWIKSQSDSFSLPHCCLWIHRLPEYSPFPPQMYSTLCTLGTAPATCFLHVRNSDRNIYFSLFLPLFSYDFNSNLFSWICFCTYAEFST